MVTSLSILGSTGSIGRQSLAAAAHLGIPIAALAARFRKGLEGAGFTLKTGEHPIIPVMIGDAGRAGAMAEALLKYGVYAIGFSFPVVPKEQARIRTQLSAAHTEEDIDFAVEAFRKAGRDTGVI